MKSYNRPQDGTTYYFQKDLGLVGHPTNIDGTCDFDPDCEVPVSEFVEPLTIRQIQIILKKLT